jgi:NitT/TauT family transport system ATP-binding protein
MAVLSSIGLRKEFSGHTPNDPSVLALKNLNFTVDHNEFCSVLGHSGCGKTTLLTIVAGFEQPTAGQLLLDGKPVGKPGWERSMIFQD